MSGSKNQAAAGEVKHAGPLPKPNRPVWRSNAPSDAERFYDGEKLLIAGLKPGSGTAWYSVVEIACDEGYFEMRAIDDDDGETLHWGDFDWWARLSCPGHNP